MSHSKPRNPKRKSNEGDSNLFVEDREGAEFPNFDKRSTKRRKANDDDEDTDQALFEDLKYIKTALIQFNKGFDDDEDKGIFVSNVLKEVNDKFLLLSCTSVGSGFFDKLLPSAALNDLVLITEIFSTNTRKMCIDLYASHVTETLIKVIFELLSKNEDDEDDDIIKIKDWVESFYTFVYNNFEMFLNEVYACHIIRVLLEESNKHNQFENKIKKFLKKVIHLENCSDLLTQPQSIALFKSLIDIIKKDEKKLDLLIRFLAKQIVISNPTSESDELPVLISNQNSSILIETIIENSSPKVFKFLLEYAETYIPSLSKHPIGNFVVQKLIKNCKTSNQLESIFEQVEATINDVLQFGYYGVLSSLAQACVQHKTKQTEFTDALISALQSSDEKLIFHVISSLNYEGLSALNLPFVNYHGSVILQHLLNFENTKSLTKSMLNLGTSGIVQLANNKFGSFIIDAFFKSESVNKVTKDKFTNLLKNSYAELACDKFGSRSLDNIWYNSSIEIRCNIADQLISNIAKMRSNFFAGKLLANYNINDYKNKPDQWKKNQATKSKGKNTKVIELIKEIEKF